MPSIKLADGELNYRFDGPVDAPVLVLSAVMASMPAPLYPVLFSASVLHCFSTKA